MYVLYNKTKVFIFNGKCSNVGYYIAKHERTLTLFLLVILFQL